MSVVGIDFGTSNCCAHAVDASGALVAIPLEAEAMLMPTMAYAARRSAQSGSPAERDQTFLSLVRAGCSVTFGTPALAAYMEDPLAGVLVKSPKSFLGSRLGPEQELFFEYAVAAILGHIRARTEAFLGSEVREAVIGRPVNWQGASPGAGNAQALAIMRRAAEAAGFERVEFLMEPFAAALEFETGVTRETLALIVDIGGGTTDCALVRLGPDRSARLAREDDVLGYSGARIGGTDFDEALAWREFMPLLGKDSLRKDGLAVPTAVLADAIATRDFPAQGRFRAAGPEIERLIKMAAEPEKLRRLQILHEENLQYRVIQAAEWAKIALSAEQAHTVELSFLENGLSRVLQPEGLDDAAARYLRKIQGLVTEVRQQAGADPERVFITGGMALSPLVRKSILAAFDQPVTLEAGDMLGTVGRGLGVHASRLPC